MTDDIVTRLREYASVSVRIVANELNEAADEIERLKGLMKAFIYQWEQEEIGKGNGTDYFHAVHAMREAVRCE